MDGASTFSTGRSDMPQSRRASTEPVVYPPTQQGSSLPSSTPSRSEELVETLYNHSSVKIIAFTSNQRAFLGPRSSHEDRPGTLPASSRLERTIAVGPFRIYRAPGSVAFLSCGSALQPILPKSQCWCIDEDNSRFVMQIRRPQYWRIELPVEESDDKDRAVELREIFDKILLFEKTECPFQRNFTVELPEQPSVIKKAWTPEGKNLISSPFSPLSSPSPRSLHGQRRASIFTDWIGPTESDEMFNERRRRFQLEGNGPHDQESPEMTTHVRDMIATYYNNPDHSPDHPPRSQSAAAFHTDMDNFLMSSDIGQTVNTSPKGRGIGTDMGIPEQEATPQDPPVSGSGKEEVISDGAGDEPSSFEGSGRIAPVNLTRKRMSRALAGRAFTVPAQVAAAASRPSKSRESSASANSRPPLPPPPPPPPPPPSHPQPLTSDDSSPFGPTAPFHNAQSWHSPITPLPPSPPSSRPVTPSRQQFPHPHEDIVLPRQTSPTRGQQPHTNTPNTDRTIPSSAGATEHSDQTASPVLCSPADGDNNRVSPTPVVESGEASQTSALEAGPKVRCQPRPRLRTHSLSISRRALSPLPSAANFFSPPQRQAPQSRKDAVRGLPGTIIHKTVAILLRPPNYLVNLMLRVAARITAGEWRGLVFGFGEGGEKIPVQWDYSDGELSGWSDDEDYAIASRSWEVD
ncbi:hypothetical protein AAE478_010526 [Parahypoxylon ruwenzoriense]